jgi:monoamine oxidase
MAIKLLGITYTLYVFSFSLALVVPTHFNKKMKEERATSSIQPKEVVIIGAGMAGLAAARQLLKGPKGRKNFKVTMLEASSDIGGRVKANHTFMPGHVVDLGAEVIHCQGHVLWDWIHDFYGPAKGPDSSGQGEDVMTEDEGTGGQVFESVFLLSHADGGPQEETTDEGKYGMYYLDNELVMYNDPRLEIINSRLEAITETDYAVDDSLADALLSQKPPLPDALWDLIVSSYGNTAGCCDLSQLSVSQLNKFENYWESHEEEGDFRPPSNLGMYGIAQSCLERLEGYNNFQLVKDCEVKSVRQDDYGATIEIKGEEVIHADTVVITVPPPILSQIVNDLPESKLEALTKIGYDRAVKVMVKFSDRFWPSHLQSIISTGEPVPEIWFREMTDEETLKTYYIATGFLVSDAADQFVDMVNKNCDLHKDRHEAAGRIVFQQLVKMLKTSISQEISIIADHSFRIVDSLMFDWNDDAPYAKGGYMHPRVGITPNHLHALAKPYGRMIFAGEATNTNACCTVQAAIETGYRAASEVASLLKLPIEQQLSTNTQ